MQAVISRTSLSHRVNTAFKLKGVEHAKGENERVRLSNYGTEAPLLLSPVERVPCLLSIISYMGFSSSSFRGLHSAAMRRDRCPYYSVIHGWRDGGFFTSCILNPNTPTSTAPAFRGWYPVSSHHLTRTRGWYPFSSHHLTRTRG